MNIYTAKEIQSNFGDKSQARTLDILYFCMLRQNWFGFWNCNLTELLSYCILQLKPYFNTIFPNPTNMFSAVEQNFKMLCTLNHRNWRKVQKHWWVYSWNWIKCFSVTFTSCGGEWFHPRRKWKLHRDRSPSNTPRSQLPSLAENQLKQDAKQ